MNYQDAINYDVGHGGLFPIVLIILFGVIGKIFFKIGILTKDNAWGASKLISAIVGLIWSFSLDFKQSYGLYADFIVHILGSAAIACVFWCFIALGLMFGINDDK